MEVTRTFDAVSQKEIEHERKHAIFNEPCALAFDYEWNLFIADRVSFVLALDTPLRTHNFC